MDGYDARSERFLILELHTLYTLAPGTEFALMLSIRHVMGLMIFKLLYFVATKSPREARVCTL